MPPVAADDTPRIKTARVGRNDRGEWHKPNQADRTQVTKVETKMKTADKLIAARQILATKDSAYLCRLIAGDSGNHPVTIVEGKQSPKKAGQSFGWEKISGPNAGERVSKSYAQKYWRNVQYVHSTLCVEVGADWLLSRRNRVERRTDDGVTMLAMPGRAVRAGNVRIIPGWIKGERKAIAIRGKRTYHMDRPSLAEVRSKAGDLAARANAEWAKQDAHAKTERLFLRDLPTTRVTLADSRRAGNCIEGSLQFAERKLGMTRAEVIGSAHLLALPAIRILHVANGQHEQAKRACYAAWLRETTISI